MQRVDASLAVLTFAANHANFLREDRMSTNTLTPGGATARLSLHPPSRFISLSSAVRPCIRTRQRKDNLKLAAIATMLGDKVLERSPVLQLPDALEQQRRTPRA